jgi:hypothetical protein
VPKGSVLGPLMFLIFINDITDEIVGPGRLFADDTSIEHIAHVVCPFVGNCDDFTFVGVNFH